MEADEDFGYQANAELQSHHAILDLTRYLHTILADIHDLATAPHPIDAERAAQILTKTTAGLREADRLHRTTL